MKGDWVEFLHTDCTVPLMTPQPCESDTYTDDGVTTFALVDANDLVAKEDALTVVRMVGEVGVSVQAQEIVNAGVDPHEIVIQSDEAIYVSTTDTAGNIITVDPRRGTIMDNDMVMWRRRTWIGVVAQGAAAGVKQISSVDYTVDAHQTSYVDIRVKRRLRQGQALLYAQGSTFIQLISSAFGPTNLDTWFLMRLSASLRGYVKF